MVETILKLTFNRNCSDPDYFETYYVLDTEYAELLCQKYGYKDIEEADASGDVEIINIVLTSLEDINTLEIITW